MAAFFTGVVRAPLTGIVLVIEMTGGFPLLLPILGGCFTAMAVPTLLRDAPIYDSLREPSLARKLRVAAVTFDPTRRDAALSPRLSDEAISVGSDDIAYLRLRTDSDYVNVPMPRKQLLAGNVDGDFRLDCQDGAAGAMHLGIYDSTRECLTHDVRIRSRLAAKMLFAGHPVKLSPQRRSLNSAYVLVPRTLAAPGAES